ncbi:E3 ubiquitin ligase BIG BROTHER-related-like isoform X2 [Primulina tabacum]|uniref:E3 ubiquitin ligase BIG BROTHER-related-like isoform X2 n=1 Tax=Primulina tabacum TaxID=48773 RepID=UPI003F5A855C
MGKGISPSKLLLPISHLYIASCEFKSLRMANTNDATDAAAEGAELDPNDIVGNPPSNGNDGENQRRRTPFTDLSQVDSDLALARTLQEQERAYMMLRIDGGDVSDYGSWETGSFGIEDNDDIDHDDYDDASEEDNNLTDVELDDDAEDVFDMYNHDGGVENESRNAELDPSVFSSDEAYARALQDAEERAMAARLLALAGINDMIIGEGDDDDDDGDGEDYGDNSQDAWDEVDPDELSYEELLALGEVFGTESRRLSVDTIASLPSVNYKSQGDEAGISDSCVICRLDYEDGETLTVLSCKHSYHTECINNWLKINKVCPVCSTEVRGRS